jgi:hypothetical protein
MLLPPAQKGGQLVCLEDSAAWAQLVQSEVDALPVNHQAVVTIIHAPLIPHGETGLPFYDLVSSGLERFNPFELLVVDGPWDVQLRRTAMPYLRHLLLPSAVIVLDDGDDPVVRETVSTWLAMEPSWDAKYYTTVKGTWVMWDRQCPWKLPLP